MSVTGNSWRNSRHGYGRIARMLHWSVAVLFLVSYVSVYYRRWFTDEGAADNLIALQLHLSIGVSIAAFVVLRVINRFMDTGPDHVASSPLEIGAARIGHFVLYAVMIVMPVTGYLGTGVATDFFWLFEIPKFADTSAYQLFVTDLLGLTFEQFEAPIDFVHKNGGAYVVCVLIAGHAAAALYHQFVRKDGTISRMIGLPPSPDGS